MTNPKLETRELPIIQLKRFQNIMSKVDTRRTPEEKLKICERYKKTVEPIQLSRYKPSCPNKPKSAIQNLEKAAASRKPKVSPKKKNENTIEAADIEEPGKCGMVCKLITNK